ncbi:MAG: D-alanine--D-alanine ligase [Akkermansia sp.]|nr:D-alanine--D-alanine ligase [Akkermansia sp.]
MKTFAKNTKIALLMGGPGSEREVSLVSGKAVAEALRRGGFTAVTEVEVRDTNPAIPEGTELVYNLIHGTFGEDGGLQALLEARGFPYTGAGPRASRNCFDKTAAKRLMIEAGVPTPACRLLDSASPDLAGVSVPCVVKPPCEGSSVGVHIVRDVEDLPSAVAAAARYGECVMVEEFIEGLELTVGILDGRALPIIHIKPRVGFYDLSNKYPWMNMGGGTDYICPADIPDSVALRVQEAALAAFRAIEIEVYARVDVLLRVSDMQPFVLEVNTIPGMTGSSLLPRAAAAAGISYEELCMRIAALSFRIER